MEKKITKTLKALGTKLLLFALSLMLIPGTGICQKFNNTRNTDFGFNTMVMVSANGCGGAYSPMVYFKDGRMTYNVGPILQNRKMNFSGIQVKWDYVIVGEDAPFDKPYNKNLELFCFFNAAYQFKALLGRRAIWEESMANCGYDGDVCQLHFKSVELYGGAGLKIRVFKNVKWINSTGLGGYSSFNLPQGLYYNPKSLGLILNTGFSIDLLK